MEDALGCKIEFIVGGAPVAKERPRATVRGGYAVIYTPKNTVQFERYVRQIAIANAPPKLLTGGLEMTLDFYLQRPQSLPVKINYNVKKPDIDNLAKSIMDALESVIYARDSQVFILNCTKQYGNPRCAIKIVEMPEE